MDVDEIVRRFLEFSPETGVVTFKEDVGRFGRVKKGAVAGCLDVHGYLQVNIKGRVLKVHRVAWFLHTGSWPIGQIDHVNHRKAREAPPFRTGMDRAARVACHVVAFRILSPIM